MPDLNHLPFPNSHDLIGLLPELVLSFAFVVLMGLDLVTPPSRRSWLAAVSVVALAGALGVTVWGWWDVGASGEFAHSGAQRVVYFGAFAYDRLSLFIDGIVIVCAMLTVLVSPGYLNRRGLHYGEYYALILAATVGMMLLGGAMSLIVIFLAIELLSISLYILSGFAHTEPRSQEAALKYLLLGSFASAILLYGMALVYGETGHTQLLQIKASLDAAQGVDALFLVGVGLFFVGYAFKVSAAPFHTWTPDVYQGAPTSVVTFMSVTTKVATFASLIRVFSYTFADTADRWTGLISFVAIVSMVIGNFAALTQTSVKRMLAYSSIAQTGYILIGVAVSPDPLGTVGSLYYLAAYAATNLGAFAVIAVMAGRGEDLDRYDSIRGLYFRRPYVAVAMAYFLFSLGGFPPSAGFFGKFLVFSAAIHAHQIYLALWGIGTSAISVVYYLRVGLLMFTRPRDEEEQYPWARTTVAGGTVLAATTAGTLVLGVLVFLIYSVAVSAQHGILPLPQQLA